jgi:hypothetical protein
MGHQSAGFLGREDDELTFGGSQRYGLSIEAFSRAGIPKPFEVYLREPKVHHGERAGNIFENFVRAITAQCVPDLHLPLPW